MIKKSKMKLTSETLTDFWNDSCSIKELKEAVLQGAVGATSNPVIVYNVIKQEEENWLPFIKQLCKTNPNASEEEIAWRLIETMGIEASKILRPVFDKTNGFKGRLSLQVNPVDYRNTEKMVEHARYLSLLAPNIAIKAPCIKQGIYAIEEMTAQGIVVNGTVCFTLPQAIACAEAIERGLNRASKNNISIDKMRPNVTIMVGRLDDQLRRVKENKKINIKDETIDWAGVAVFKKAFKIFKKRQYRSTLLAAAYRNHLQWSELMGGNVVLTIPYKWWNTFNDSDIEIKERINNPVDPIIIQKLYESFSDFRKAYDEDGMNEEDFIHFGASIHTLEQFISGYYDLLSYIREKRFKSLSC